MWSFRVTRTVTLRTAQYAEAKLAGNFRTRQRSMCHTIITIARIKSGRDNFRHVQMHTQAQAHTDTHLHSLLAPLSRPRSQEHVTVRILAKQPFYDPEPDALVGASHQHPLHLYRCRSSPSQAQVLPSCGDWQADMSRKENGSQRKVFLAPVLSTLVILAMSLKRL